MLRLLLLFKFLVRLPRFSDDRDAVSDLQASGRACTPLFSATRSLPAAQVEIGRRFDGLVRDELDDRVAGMMLKWVIGVSMTLVELLAGLRFGAELRSRLHARAMPAKVCRRDGVNVVHMYEVHFQSLRRKVCVCAWRAVEVMDIFL
ncbi:hypothetical protein DQ04_02951080 [Trypanosoma grayi]|uniref:hypothetical protein n=1 Tax=Trypanosoma grayi TaxID=71804 RepID=UPI0004F4A374|nr:hypothetical protein DQ04_02951080 [Trypanosoma grayi]KEG11130.1 hypothetical protein DQ04_02951080 [Trypanosoma grayi]